MVSPARPIQSFDPLDGEGSKKKKKERKISVSTYFVVIIHKTRVGLSHSIIPPKEHGLLVESNPTCNVHI